MSRNEREPARQRVCRSRGGTQPQALYPATRSPQALRGCGQVDDAQSFTSRRPRPRPGPRRSSGRDMDGAHRDSRVPIGTRATKRPAAEERVALSAALRDMRRFSSDRPGPAGRAMRSLVAASREAVFHDTARDKLLPSPRAVRRLKHDHPDPPRLRSLSGETPGEVSPEFKRMYGFRTHLPSTLLDSRHQRKGLTRSQRSQQRTTPSPCEAFSSGSDPERSSATWYETFWFL